MKRAVIIGAIILLIVLGGLYLDYLFACEDDWCYHYPWQKDMRNNDLSSESAPAIDNSAQNDDSELNVVESPVVLNDRPVLYGLGINIDNYDSQTKMAGDLIFTKDLLFDDGRVDNDKAFVDFGIKAKYFEDSVGNVEYWFHVPLGTDVKAPLAGTVEVYYIEHTKDWAVSIKQPNHDYIVSFEHMVNLLVKEGGYVSVGDVLGDASPRNTLSNKFAMVELAVWKGGSRIEKFCPFDFLDDSLKADYTLKINNVAKEWESFIGKDVYQQEKWVSPGCLVEMIFET